MKILILFLIGINCFFININEGSSIGIFDEDDEVIYCNNGECGLEKGIEEVEGAMGDDIETDRKASEYIQDVIIYLLSFITLLAVFYVIYAGFNILTSAGEEEKVKKSKTTIFSVLLGIIIIWLAYSIVKWIMVLVAANP